MHAIVTTVWGNKYKSVCVCVCVCVCVGVVECGWLSGRVCVYMSVCADQVKLTQLVQFYPHDEHSPQCGWESHS